MNIYDNSPVDQVKSGLYGPRVPVRHVLFLCLAFCTVGMLSVAVFVQLLERLLDWDRNTLVGQLTLGGPMEEVWKLRFVAGLNQLLVFLLPGFMTVWMLRKSSIGPYSSFLRVVVPAPSELFLGAGLLVVSMPFVLFTFELNKQLPVPEVFKIASEAAATTVRVLLQMPGVSDLLANILLVAIIPALGEEFIFRGILQGQLMRKWSPGIAILVSGAIFSFVHFQVDGFLPRWILGIILGWLFWRTANLLVPIFVHFLNNGVQIFGAYFFRDSADIFEIEQEVGIPIALAVLSFLVTAYVLWYWRIRPEAT